MQQNFRQKNKSNLIRTTEEAKRKSRHRLMGSIFLLLVALVVLLNVTSKVKPIPLKPENIEIQNTATPVNSTPSPIVSSQVVANNNQIAQQSSAPISNNLNAKNIVEAPKAINDDLNNVKEINVNTPAKTQLSHKSTLHHNELSTENINLVALDKNLKLNPRIIEEANTHKTPEDILDGKISNSSTEHYFVQLIASNNKEKTLKLQQELNKKGVKTFMQPVQTANGTMYRLRMGPFANKDIANKNLHAISNSNN